MPCTPQRANAFRSAWMPAPPPESEPAIERTAGGAIRVRLGGRILLARVSRVGAFAVCQGGALDAHRRALGRLPGDRGLLRRGVRRRRVLARAFARGRRSRVAG